MCIRDRCDAARVAFFLACVTIVFLTCYLLPLACISVFYALIGARVWRRRVGHLAVQSRAAANIRRSKTRLLRMLVTVVVLFAASWLPLYAINLRRMFADPPGAGSVEKRVLERYVGPLAQWLGASNSCINPFVYCYFSHGFSSRTKRQDIHCEERRRRCDLFSVEWNVKP